MFCPHCAHPNWMDVKKCEKCNTRIDYMQKSLFPGHQFVFVKADKDHPVALKVNTSLPAVEDFDDTLDSTDLKVYDKPAILSRHQTSVHFGDSVKGRNRRGIEPLYDLDRLSFKSEMDLLTVVTDRKVYKPHNDAQVFIVALEPSVQQVSFEIQMAGQKVYETEVALNSNGLALHRLSDLREGEYTVIVTTDKRELSGESTFSVAEFTLSPLIAILEDHHYSNKELHFTLKLLLLSVPYTGEVELGLQCHVCGDQVVATDKVKVSEGRVKGKFDLSYHGGPFRVQIITPDGNTALVSFPGTGALEREHIQINPLGDTAEASLLPWEDSHYVRGLHIGSGEVNMTPLILDRVYADKGTLIALTDIEQVKVVLFNKGEQREIIKENLQGSHSLEFDVQAPYTFFTVGAFTKKGPFEGWGMVIKPVEFEARLTAPDKSQPGEEIDVEISVDASLFLDGVNSLSCLLLLYDARLEHESPVPKLAKEMFENIRAATKDLTVGTVSPRIHKKKMLNNLEMDSFEEPPIPLMAAPLKRVMTKSYNLLESVNESVEGIFYSHHIVEDYDGIAGSALDEITPDIDSKMPEIVTAPIRMEFPELAFIELFSLDNKVLRTIKLGEQIGTWRVRAYVFKGLDYKELTLDIEAEKALYAEPDLPAIVSDNDDITASVNYSTRERADLMIATPFGTTKTEVKGSGVEFFSLKGPGRVEIRIISQNDSDWTMRTIDKPGVQKVTASRLMLLDTGQTVQGERVVVYPSVGYALKDTVDALVRYPFGCAEQTSSTLYGLALAYRSINSGMVTGDLAAVNGRIMDGVQRLEKFHHNNGLFSLWENGTPETELTGLIAGRLLAFRDLSYGEAHSLVDISAKALLKADYRSNSLLALSSEFGTEMISNEDAAAYYFYGNGKKKQALEFLHQTVEHEGNKAYWRAQSSWGGNLEVTADAARVMYHSKDKLFGPAFVFVTSNLINGMLYSTADTRALVELLSLLTFDPADKAIIDGREAALNDIMVGTEVTALSSNLIVRVDEEIEIDHLKPRGDFQFTVKSSKKRIKLGERIQIRVTPKEQSRAPLARLFLPGTLALLKGGANAQTAYLPIKHNELTVDAVAVRRGKGKLHVSIHDMYDAEKVGTIPGVKITVE